LPSLDWYDVLWVLESSRAGRLRMAEIARWAVFSRSNLTRLADRMEKARLIERGDCPEDGRGTVCELTARGRALRAKMWQVYREQIDRLFGRHLKASEANTIAACFEKIIHPLRKERP
ncbi:MAG: MarR family transcriptional regulator, partial [Burkholderiales bacterium]|nr:MarR family transcriptional regulator [Burkholderiales bacterium]